MTIRGRYNPINYANLAGKLDHGLLLGLSDDDHGQYFADTTIGTRAKNYTTTGTLTATALTDTVVTLASGVLTIPINTSDAFVITDANLYFGITTTTGSESMEFGNITTNPTFDFFGSGLTTLGGDLDCQDITSTRIIADGTNAHQLIRATDTSGAVIANTVMRRDYGSTNPVDGDGSSVLYQRVMAGTVRTLAEMDIIQDGNVSGVTNNVTGKLAFAVRVNNVKKPRILMDQNGTAIGDGGSNVVQVSGTGVTTFTGTAKLQLPNVTDAGPMTGTNGTESEIVYNTSDNKAYVCTATGTPATWAALN